MSRNTINSFKNSPARFSNIPSSSPSKKKPIFENQFRLVESFRKMKMKWRKMAETFERKIAEIVERFVSWIRIMAFEGVRIKSPPLPSSPLQTSHAQPCFRKRQCELEITIPRLIVILARKRITIRNRARKIWDLERGGVPKPRSDTSNSRESNVIIIRRSLSRRSPRNDARWA